MEISILEENDSAKITITGKIDESGAEEMKKNFYSLNLQKIKQVTVDLGGVSHIGSSGIGKILLFYKNLAIEGGSLSVVNTSELLHELFKELKLDTLFTIEKK